MGEVITFKGLYAADKGQAAAVTFYTFFGMASVALVLSILVPDVGNWWYGLTLLSPAAYTYYMSRGTREEEVGGLVHMCACTRGPGLSFPWAP